MSVTISLECDSTYDAVLLLSLHALLSLSPRCSESEIETFAMEPHQAEAMAIIADEIATVAIPVMQFLNLETSEFSSSAAFQGLVQAEVNRRKGLNQ